MTICTVYIIYLHYFHIYIKSYADINKKNFTKNAATTYLGPRIIVFDLVMLLLTTLRVSEGTFLISMTQMLPMLICVLYLAASSWSNFITELICL